MTFHPAIITPQTPPHEGVQIEHEAICDPFSDTTATSAAGRFTVLTANRQAAFLRNLQLFGNVRLACRAASVSAQTAYRARRASPGFMLAWDTALLAARTHAEATLADRAINGVEEAVYYHGEEVARRRRYDSRLLLAHLARLDRLEERDEIADALPLLDACIDALDEGADIDAILGAVDAGETALVKEVRKKPQDSVPPVPSWRVCGGECDDPEALLGPQDCQWLGNRLDRMEAARPEDAPSLCALAGTLTAVEVDVGALEAAQLEAFEAGEADWWKVVPGELSEAG